MENIVSLVYKVYREFNIKQKEKIESDIDLFNELYSVRFNNKCIKQLDRDNVFSSTGFSEDICEQLSQFIFADKLDSKRYKSCFYNKEMEKERLQILNNAKTIVEILSFKAVPSPFFLGTYAFFNLTEEEYEKIDYARKQVVQSYKKNLELAYKATYISQVEKEYLS